MPPKSQRHFAVCESKLRTFLSQAICSYLRPHKIRNNFEAKEAIAPDPFARDRYGSIGRHMVFNSFLLFGFPFPQFTLGRLEECNPRYSFPCQTFKLYELVHVSCFHTIENIRPSVICVYIARTFFPANLEVFALGYQGSFGFVFVFIFILPWLRSGRMAKWPANPPS